MGSRRSSCAAGYDELGTIPRRIARYDKTFHFVGNHHCVLDGDKATGEVYCTAHHLNFGTTRGNGPPDVD